MKVAQRTLDIDKNQRYALMDEQDQIKNNRNEVNKVTEEFYRKCYVIIIIINNILFSMSSLQNEDLPKPFSLISIGCQSIPGYSRKTFYLIFPSSSLSAMLLFSIPRLPFSYSNIPSFIFSVHNMSCPCPLFFLTVTKMPSTLVCSLIHDVLFLSLQSLSLRILKEGKSEIVTPPSILSNKSLSFGEVPC